MIVAKFSDLSFRAKRSVVEESLTVIRSGFQTVRDVSTPLDMTKEERGWGGKCSSVISDCQRGANVHGALCGGHFLWRFWLFRKMNGSLIAVIRQKSRRFLETETAQRAAGVHVPRPRHVLGLFAQFVRHNLNKRMADGEESYFRFHTVRRSRFTRHLLPLRSRFFRSSEATAKSTCRLNVSTRTTKTRTSSPMLNRLRDRLPMSRR